MTRFSLLLLLASLVCLGACFSPQSLTSTAPDYSQPEAAPRESAPVVAAAPAPATSYVVRMHRPAHVGDEHLVVIETRETETSLGSRDGRLLGRQTEMTSITVRARRRVLEVDEAGKIVLARYEVMEATQRSSQGARLLLPAGSVVVRRRAPGGGSMRLESGSLPADVREALRFPLGDRLAPVTDDGAFGTDEPRVVGDAWPVHRAQVVEMLNAPGEIRAAAQNVMGETRLEEVVDVDGVECLRFSSHFEAGAVELLRLPRGGTHRAGRVVMSAEITIPTDLEGPVLREDAGGTLEFTFDLRQRRQPVVQMRVERERRRSFALYPLTR